MPDGEIDVIFPVVDRRNGEQRGDRPALDEPETVADQAPFDVLRTVEMRFDPPAELGQFHDLCVGERRPLLLRRVDRLFVCPAGR